MFLFTLRDNHGRAFFDGLADEFVSVIFLSPQRHEETVFLHSPRVIRDTFHCAIKRPDELTDWNCAGKSFELHESSASRRKALNGVRH